MSIVIYLIYAAFIACIALPFFFQNIVKSLLQEKDAFPACIGAAVCLLVFLLLFLNAV